jgi:hypothetical protein
MKGADTIAWVGGALIGLTLVDLFILRRWIRFDRTRASWVRLFVHDFAAYTLLMFVLIFMISASTGVDFLQLVLQWNWTITFANVILGIVFRWLVTGKFRRPKANGETGDQSDPTPATK